jgi:hypothetical protein
MVDPQGFHAFVKRILLMDGRQALHLEIEFQRDAMRVANTDRAALKRALDPFDIMPLRGKVSGGAINILFREQAERHIAA